MAESKGELKKSGCGQAASDQAAGDQTARGTGGSDTQGGGGPKSGIAFQYKDDQPEGDVSEDSHHPTAIKTGLGSEANDQK